VLVDGERVFKRFPTLTEAVAFAWQLYDDRAKHGKSAFDLPLPYRTEAARCLELLRPYPDASLTQAVQYFVEKVLRYRQSPVVNDIVAKLINEKSKANRRERTLDNLRSRWGRFAADFGDRQLGTITEAECSAWLDKVGTSPANRHNYRRAVMQLYRAAIRRRWCSTNTMHDATERVELDEKPVGILTVAQCAKLLECADQFGLLAYVVIGLFCGVRREELERLQWDAVKLPQRLITIGADVAKLRRQRHVTINDTAAAWLAGIVKKTGPVVDPVDFRKRFDAWRKKAGIRRWPDNGLRHTFGSIHLATGKDEVRTAHEMGNSPSMVHRHYKSLLTEAEAARYWSLRPTTGTKIVPLPASHEQGNEQANEPIEQAAATVAQ
jgi:integrase